MASRAFCHEGDPWIAVGNRPTRNAATGPSVSRMTASETKTLHREVERYLSAIELFRQEGCEPLWSTEEKGTSPKRDREVPDATAARRS